MNIEELMEIAFRRDASDLHIVVGYNPSIRMHGRLSMLSEYPIVTEQQAKELLFSILSPEQKDIFSGKS